MRHCLSVCRAETAETLAHSNGPTSLNIPVNAVCLGLDRERCLERNAARRYEFDPTSQQVPTEGSIPYLQA